MVYGRQILEISYWMTIEDFTALLKDPDLEISEEVLQRLDQTREFIGYLLGKKISVYGLTTGFADLRRIVIPANQADELSYNIIHSHDAGIGAPLPMDVTLGAMILRAHSLSKGYSGFSKESLANLIEMINRNIIPLIPSTGSLGASGDLAYLARLGRAMMGEEVLVSHQGTITTAATALLGEGIPPFCPKAKEGLALTNGTSFMASMLAIAFTREIQCLENLLKLTGLFLNSVGAIEDAFHESLQTIRYQNGQQWIASILRKLFPSSSEDHTETQNDYCIRCLPQIYGPRFELILEQKSKIERELNAITDNPLIFRGEEIASETNPARIFHFQDLDWAVLSGGNFHGENLTAIADLICLSNAKLALTIERQMTYLMNPFRNKGKLPLYLIADPTAAGLSSGFMVTQYTANALAHKICLLAQPAGNSNITSANESEDVVSYGATACHKLLDQIALFEELLSIYLTACAQSYALVRQERKSKNAIVEKIFEIIQDEMEFPQTKDKSFDAKFQTAKELLMSGIFQQTVGSFLPTFTQKENGSAYSISPCLIPNH